MSDREWKRALGQLMMVGVPGTRLSPDWERRFSDLAPAGVILFRRNVESLPALRTLTGRLERLAVEGGFSPLLISADEEGGFLSPILGMDDPAPAAMALGSAESGSLAFESARLVGTRLRRAGINLNLAPCLDVNDEPDNPVIGPRSFGSDPSVVSRLGVRTLEGLRAGGVLSTAKHFPGHGSTRQDSHKTLPVDARSPEDLRRCALPPFRAAIEAGVDLVMTAHVAFPAVTGGTNEPATFSRRIVGDLLRDEIGFDGVVITDALEMVAVSRGRSVGEAALRGLSAGADLLLDARQEAVSSDVRAALAAAEGRLSTERLRESFGRIRALKKGIPAPGNATGGDVFREARRRGIRVLADPHDLIPLRIGEGDRLGVLVPDAPLPEGGIDAASFERDLRLRHDRVQVVRAVPGESVPVATLDGCMAIVVLVLCRGPLVSWQADLVRSISECSPRRILVAALNPWALPEGEKDAARVATYDFSPCALRALVERLFGETGG